MTTPTTPTAAETGALRCEFEVEFAPGPHPGCAEFTPETPPATFRCAHAAVAALETIEETVGGTERVTEHLCPEHAELVEEQATALEHVTLVGRFPFTTAHA